MRFLVDMPLSVNLSHWLTANGHDSIHTSGIGLHRADDVDIMAHASQEHRVVVTADLDYPRLLAMSGDEGPGLILFRGGDYSYQESIERLNQALSIVPVDELPTSILVIERERIRRRRLPIESD